MRTSEATGIAICYSVCMLEMPHLVWGDTIGLHHASNQIVVPLLPEPDCYSPYMSWSMFGPIIEREKIQLTPLNQSNPKHGWAAAYLSRGEWGDELYSLHRQRGLSPLIAAMRCYVSSKLGSHLELPTELR